MKMTYKFVVLLFAAHLFYICRAEWTTPLSITNSTRDSTFPEMYIDPATKITHLLWIDNLENAYRLSYARMYPDKTMSPPVLLDTTHRCFLSHIIGEGDGKHLLIAYDGKRTQGDKNNCGGGDSRGCFDVFFTESFDGGMTWTPSIVVPHEDPNDERERKGPRMIFVKETKQTFITYWRTGPMAYTTRYANSSSFTTEQIYPFCMSTAYQSIVYTLGDNGSPIFHFIYSNWSYPEEHMMYTSSLDNGKSWNTPKELVAYVHQSRSDSYFRPYTVANNAIMPKGVFVTFVWNNEIYLMWSLNNGITWSRMMPTHRGNAIAPRIQICPAPKGQRGRVYLMFGLRTPQNEQSFVFGSLNLQSFLYRDEQFPFKKHMFNWDYLVDCYADEKTLTAAAIVETYVDGNNYIYLSYNDKLSGLTE